MIGRTLRAHARLLTARVAARARRVARSGESGFILLESLIAISLITVIMGAVGAEYVSGLSATNAARRRAVAVEVAGTALDQIQALHPSDLLSGRGSSAVDAERSTVANFTTLPASTSVEAYDSTAPASATGTTVTTTPSATTVGSITYTVYRYFECTSAAVAGSCKTTPSQSSLTSNNIRAIVVATWPQRGCASVTTATTSGPTCAYATSSIINADSDLTFDLNQQLPTAPLISNASALTVAVGDAVSYAMAVQSNTGVSPFTWAVTSGALPSGLTMGSSGQIIGTVSGAPTTTSSTITVTDAYLRTASDTITWTVEAPLAITQLADQSSVIGATVSKALTATGGGGTGYTFALTSGTLPAGLSLSSSGVISGVVVKSPGTVYPTTYALTVTVTDPQACPACVTTPRTATMGFRWTVNPPPLVVGNPGPQRWTVGTPVGLLSTVNGLQLTASGGDGIYVWGVTGLPLGLTVNPVTGVITGVPQTSGSGSATITVTDVISGTAVSASTTFSWTVFARPTITTPGSQLNSVGGTVQLGVAATCPNTPCTYSAVSLPSGLAIDPTTGVISGTVGGSPGTYLLNTVQITDSAGAVATSLAFRWTVLNGPGIGSLGTQNYTETASHSVAVAYTCPISACTITLANPMPGLGLTTSATTTGNNTNASLAIANTSGTVYVAGTVQNSAVTGTALSAVYNPVLTITTSDLASASSPATTWTAYAVPTVTSPGAQQSAQYAVMNESLTTTCPNVQCTYTLSGGPAGLSVTSAGVITGTISSSPQRFTGVTVTVTDADGVTATSTAFTWTVVAATNNLASLFNNVGVSVDTNTNAANFDGSGYSYSATALANAGVTAGSTLTYGGLSFTWPSTSGTGQPDNVVANSQVVTVSGNGSTLGLLVSSAYGPGSGTGTVTYTDGTTQGFSLSAPDWASGGSSPNIAVTSAYRNAANNGRDPRPIYVFGVTVAVNPAKVVATVKLPPDPPGSASIHVWAMSLTGAGLASSANNVGVTTPGSSVTGNFDGSNNTFSKTALASAGATPGAPITSNGVTFTWPSTAGNGSPDNTLSSGQTITPSTTLSGSTLGFLLAASGPTPSGSSGTGTITYTDGTQQTFTLGAPTWNSSISSSAALSTASYDAGTANRSTPGQAYVYYAGVPIATGKAIATVTLPAIGTSVSSAALHIFAMAVK